MRKKLSFLLALLVLTVFAFLPSSGLAKASENLTQQEIDNLLTNNGVISPTSRVTTSDEMTAIENYYQENPNAVEENIEVILEKLNLEQVEIISTEEINQFNNINTKNIQPMNTLPNAGMVMFRNVTHSDKLFYATLYARNIGVDSIDQIGGRVYGYAILPNTDYSTIVLNEFFNETYIKPFLDRKIGDYNFAHHKNRASFMAEYVVREGDQVVTPTPAGVSFVGMK